MYVLNRTRCSIAEPSSFARLAEIDKPVDTTLRHPPRQFAQGTARTSQSLDVLIGYCAAPQAIWKNPPTEP